jgi:4-hydroxy-3-polyprenylbenzoate decarboxylase
MWATTVGKIRTHSHDRILNRTATLWHDLGTMKVPGIQSVYIPPKLAAVSGSWCRSSRYPGLNHVGNAVITCTTPHYGVRA